MKENEEISSCIISLGTRGKQKKECNIIVLKVIMCFDAANIGKQQPWNEQRRRRRLWTWKKVLSHEVVILLQPLLLLQNTKIEIRKVFVSFPFARRYKEFNGEIFFSQISRGLSCFFVVHRSTCSTFSTIILKQRFPSFDSHKPVQNVDHIRRRKEVNNITGYRIPIQRL